MLTCQTDSYRRTLRAAVLSATPHEGSVAVVLADTVLYPAGGGQPSDTGTVDGQVVQRLWRSETGQVVHLLAAAPAGEEVEVVVDWPRRLDHMQQHSAQHLLSAIAADRFDACTRAFHLQPELCDIDLSRALSAEEVASLQDAVNAEIRAARPIRARLVARADLDAVRSRGLPAGHTGPVRIVEIAGIDQNTCGGTHVASTAELQAVVLLPPLPQKGGCTLRYLAGGRVLARLGAAEARATALSRALSCGPAEHLAAVQRLQDSAKATERASKHLQQELAGLLGAGLQGHHLHRDGADLSFLRSIAAAADPAEPRLLTGAGVFLLIGPPASVAALGPPVAAALQGRGGGRGGRYQGRIGRMDRIEAAAALVAGHR